jgi:GGDEF domain-containing protein
MNKQQKNSSGLSAFIAAICIIIYLFALTQAAVRIYLSIDEQKAAAEREFSWISDLATSTGAQGFMDEQFIRTMNNALGESFSLEALIVTGPDGEYGFEKHHGRAITWVNNSPRFINKLSLSSENYYRPLPLRDVRNANIRAIAESFNFNEISRILRETLFLILIGFAVSFFTLLLFLLLSKPSEKAKVVSSPVDDTVEEKTVVQKSEQQKPERESSIIINAGPAIIEKGPKEIYSSRGNIGWEEDNAVTKHEKKEPLIINAGPAVMGKGPKGLYSTRSNIGWEEYTNERLDSELHRCSSTEHDLTLITMEFTDMTNDSMFRQAAEEAASFFGSRDMLFEYGKYGISVILPGDDLETGISKSEKFHQRMTGKFPPGPNSVSNLFIGLSSRSGRLLNAERLMFESKQALEKAKQDPKSSIIAFKSDPEKYRAFIRNQS